MREGIKQTRRQRTKNRQPGYVVRDRLNLKAIIRLQPALDLARWENEGGAVTSLLEKGPTS